MHTRDLRGLYINELQEARSFERQIASAFGELEERATDPDLRRVLTEEGPEARGHAEALAELLRGHGEEADAHHDAALEAMLDEAHAWSGAIEDPAVRDAALIASAQRVQHSEIAVFGSPAAWAGRLGLPDRERLEAILEAGKRADAKLTELALRRVNAQAED